MRRTRLRTPTIFATLWLGLWCLPASAQHFTAPYDFTGLSPYSSNFRNMMAFWDMSMNAEAFVRLNSLLAQRRVLGPHANAKSGAQDDSQNYVPHMTFHPIAWVGVIEAFANNAAKEKDPTDPQVYDAAYFRGQLHRFEMDSTTLGMPVNNVATACAYFIETAFLLAHNAAITDAGDRTALRGACTRVIASRQMSGYLRTDLELTRSYQTFGITAAVLADYKRRAEQAHDPARIVKSGAYVRTAFEKIFPIKLDRYATVHDLLCADVSADKCDALLAQERQLAE